MYTEATKPGIVRSTRSGSRALRAELAVAARMGDGTALAAPSCAEVRRARRLDRCSKRELTTMVIRLEREVKALHCHNANLRERLLRNSLGLGRELETVPVAAGLPT